MRIIDAHFHIFPDHPFVAKQLQANGHENTYTNLFDCYQDLGIVSGIVMGNHRLEPEYHQYPEPLFYCVGLDDMVLEQYPNEALPDLVESNLKNPRCVGIKLYTGYHPTYLSDPFYNFVYELAAKYQKPVAAHMGMTAGSDALLKYSHPLTIDEAAVMHPDVNFIMCHFGNPFLAEAAAVLEKNDNVFCDLSGLIEGVKDWDIYFEEQSGYVQQLRTWMAYVENWDKFMFGTDLPAVNLGNYVAFIKRLIPERYWNAVFFENANRIYNLNL